MSSSDKQEQSAKKSPVGLIIILFLILGAALVAGLYNNAKQTQASEDQPEAAPAEKTVDTAQADSNGQSPEVQPVVNTDPAPTAAMDIEALSTPRILGNPEAPLEISEHSSFTCGACGAFHKGNFKQIKKDYIDTGKAYIVFDDFPRNKFDVQVGAVARCLPDESYFNFIQLMFEMQEKTLNFLRAHKYDEFENYIKQNAALAGAKNAQACLESRELHEALAARQKLATQEHDVNSTPTLVLNNATTISGIAPYDQIKQAIEAELAKTAQ